MGAMMTLNDINPQHLTPYALAFELLLPLHTIIQKGILTPCHITPKLTSLPIFLPLSRIFPPALCPCLPCCIAPSAALQPAEWVGIGEGERGEGEERGEEGRREKLSSMANALDGRLLFTREASQELPSTMASSPAHLAHARLQQYVYRSKDRDDLTTVFVCLCVCVVCHRSPCRAI